ncbi:MULTISPECIES: Ms4533A family Cys-rich leader peptide [Antrihabitans]|uniref:Ms4533A family Cys-rich leader peptide n=1 Tax=Antrihabitans spumae TaxID=3373370 RepID=A0ABW7KJR8_9NOCA
MSADVVGKVRHRLALIAIGMLAVADVDCR